MTEETKAAESQAAENAGENNPQENSGNETTTANQAVGLPTIYGQKAGMTQIFDESGNHVPVSVIRLIPNRISQVKTKEKDGYQAYQLAFGEKREKLGRKPQKGHLEKAKVEQCLTKFAEVKTDEAAEENLGRAISLEAFTPSSYIDVTGTSKGKGFQGVIKKYGFSGGPQSHGSKFHRSTGSIGMSATPSRVLKKKKMPGQMGSEKVTVQNLQVVEVNEEKGYMLVKGSVPGSKNGFVRISKATKK